VGIPGEVPGGRQPAPNTFGFLAPFHYHIRYCPS